MSNRCLRDNNPKITNTTDNNGCVNHQKYRKRLNLKNSIKKLRNKTIIKNCDYLNNYSYNKLNNKDELKDSKNVRISEFANIQGLNSHKRNIDYPFTSKTNYNNLRDRSEKPIENNFEFSRNPNNNILNKNCNQSTNLNGKKFNYNNSLFTNGPNDSIFRDYNLNFNNISNGFLNNSSLNNYENVNNNNGFLNNTNINNNYIKPNNNSFNFNEENINYKNTFFPNPNSKQSEIIQKNMELQDYFFNPNRPIIQMDIVEQIKFILKQYDFYLQLVLQNILLTDDMDLKFRSYSILYNLYLQRMRILNYYKLPQFDIYFNFCKV